MKVLVAVLVGAVLVAGCGREITGQDPEVQATLDELAVRVADDVDAVTGLALSELSEGAEMVATWPSRWCQQGHHGWKRNDPFDLWCFDDGDDLPALLADHAYALVLTVQRDHD